MLGLECDVSSEAVRRGSRQRRDWRRAHALGRGELRRDLGRARQVAVPLVTADTWRRIVDVNLTGVFLVSQAVARVLAAGDGGVIVNISSVSGIGAEEDAAAYCASKAGVIGLTRAMSLDLAQHGIRVCAIAPGDIDTARSREVAEATESRLPKATPLGAGQPGDVAAAVAFLLSDDARFVSGTTLVVDGALMAY